MKSRPILFGAPMVRALLSGAKTQKKLYVKRGESPTSVEHIAARLLAGITKISDTGCWLWGRSLSAGYGSMTIGRKTVRAHRVAYALANGRCERSLLEICHQCDTPACVNPDHLFEGTHGDNVRDAVRKGRARPPIAPRLVGEKNPASKLSDAQRAEIRAAVGVTQTDLARRFGVSQSCISLVRGGRHA